MKLPINFLTLKYTIKNDQILKLNREYYCYEGSLALLMHYIIFAYILTQFSQFYFKKLNIITPNKKKMLQIPLFIR